MAGLAGVNSGLEIPTGLNQLSGLSPGNGLVLSGNSRSSILAGTYSSVVAAAPSDNSLIIRDPVTPANNYSGPLITAGVFNKFTYTNASSNRTFVGSNGLIQYAGVNVPRIAYDPVTLAIQGYLHEGARTNLSLQSEAFDNASWSKNQSSVTANTQIAPDGNMTADTLTENTTNNIHSVLQACTTVAASVYTASGFMKSGARTWCSLRESAAVTATAYFNLSSGVIGTVSGTGNPSATIKAFPNGWYLCTMTFTAGGASSRVRICTATADNTDSYTGDGTSGIYIWGAGLELGGAASSYIPTATVSVTRAVDVLNLPNTSFNLTSSIGTMYVKNSWQGGTAINSGNRAALGLDDGGATNRTYLNNLAGASGYTNTSVPNSGSDLAVADGVFVKSALAFAASDWAFVQNGRTPITAASGTPPTVTTLRIGDVTSAGTFPAFATIAEFMDVGQRVANTAMQSLTT